MLPFSFTPFPTLTTERLRLRQLRDDDAEKMFLLRSDAEVMKYISKPPAKSMDEIRSHMKVISELHYRNEAINWVITLNGNDSLIGVICIWHIQWQHARGEVGYTMLPDYHGKGIMDESLKAILTYGFNTVKLHSMEAHVHPENQASIKLLEKNNFTREAYFKENFFYDGKFFDTAVYSLINNADK